MKHKKQMARIMLILLLIYLMILMVAGCLGGQHFREVETVPIYVGGRRDYVRGVYIVRQEVRHERY